MEDTKIYVKENVSMFCPEINPEERNNIPLSSLLDLSFINVWKKSESFIRFMCSSSKLYDHLMVEYDIGGIKNFLIVAIICPGNVLRELDLPEFNHKDYLR
ncbi:MAG: hypothetical protein PHE32_03400 [Candidatus Shapirobacteria bacterium]|nr:hypothetical protein [Candidatus Shapirobacteria bacterium]MDD4410719.1 hypothetical protein [Candidatus Shapirobacteria bacterium]